MSASKAFFALFIYYSQRDAQIMAIAAFKSHLIKLMIVGDFCKEIALIFVHRGKIKIHIREGGAIFC